MSSFRPESIAKSNRITHSLRSRFSPGWLLVILVGLLLPGAVPVLPQADPADPYIRNPRLGIAHISAAEGGTDDLRYRQALTLGAYWNRYPIYWDRVETQPGQFDWQAYDIQVRDDLAYGLGINAVLLGRPPFYHAPGDTVIQGLYEPVFTDGSDYLHPGARINPLNRWAVFVYEVVNRYKPGGMLSQSGGLAPDAGIRVWEIWNEPDFRQFWEGSIADYARLLKVAYLAAHLADPEAEIMFAGLLFNTPDNWLARVLAIYTTDVDREQFNWYIDQVAVHSYDDPWRTGWLVLNMRQSLKAYGLDRPIQVTETGARVWDDYPGPTWAVSSTPVDLDLRRNRVTQLQQAWFMIQSAVYAWSEGADVVIVHQLYDDCGDQAAGTDFPPQPDGSLCQFGACAGDAHGLIRNRPGSICFGQHPQGGTARPAAGAYRLLAQLFATPFERVQRLDLHPDAVAFAFDRSQSGDRVVILWSRRLHPVTVTLPALGENAALVRLSGSQLITPNTDQSYTLELPAAQPDNYPVPPQGADTAIGGEPVIIVERINGTTPLVSFELDLDLTLNEVAALPVTTITPTAPPRPTTDPAQDTSPPTAFLLPLPEVSPATFTLTWQGQDDSGIASYTVWMRVNGEGWQPWLATDTTSAEFTGQPGSTYEFDIWAVDLAGNWSTNVELSPLVMTRVE